MLKFRGQTLRLHLFIDEIKENGHQDVWNGHKIDNAIVHTLGHGKVLLTFENRPTHGALGI